MRWLILPILFFVLAAPAQALNTPGADTRTTEILQIAEGYWAKRSVNINPDGTSKCVEGVEVSYSHEFKMMGLGDKAAFVPYLGACEIVYNAEYLGYSRYMATRYKENPWIYDAEECNVGIHEMGHVYGKPHDEDVGETPGIMTETGSYHYLAYECVSWAKNRASAAKAARVAIKKQNRYTRSMHNRGGK